MNDGECSQAGCGERATCYPVFIIEFLDDRPARRVVAPFAVCSAHAHLILCALRSPARLAFVRSGCGEPAGLIDWERCRVEFVSRGPSREVARRAVWRE